MRCFGVLLPTRHISLWLALLCTEFAAAQSVVNSTYLRSCGGTYSNVDCWSPAGVPNNTGSTVYNVFGGDGFTVDIDATISNLTLSSTTAPLIVDRKVFTVTGTTMIDFANSSIWVNSSTEPGKFDAGTLSAFSDHTLRGRYSINGSVLQFRGADIWTLRDGSLGLYYPQSAIIDEAGNDALANLALIEASANFTVSNRDFSIPGAFTNNGTLDLFNSIFAITGTLNNFDAGSRTLTGGTYSLVGNGPTVLKFSGADIVHNAASIILGVDFISNGYPARITDLADNDALRNFSDNLAAGSFTLEPGQLFVAPGNFTNAGTVMTGALVPIGREHRTRPEFRVPPGFSYTQSAGMTANAGTFTADNINILGGAFVSRLLVRQYGVPSLGSVSGSLNVSQGVLVPSGTVSGNLTLGPNGRFHPTIGAYNDSILIQGSTNLNGALEPELTGYRFPDNSEVITVLQSSGPMTGAFRNAPNQARIKTTDGSGSFLVIYESNAVKLAQFELSPAPARLLNISTRGALDPADKDPAGDRSVLIAGFIISGADPKKVVIRGLGPSLAKAGVNSPLPDPKLELHRSDASIVLSNNDWRNSQQAEILATGLAPADDRESAVVTTLVPGSYTVVVRELKGAAGTALVEVYDISGGSNSLLANISTRGLTDDANPLIGGVIAAGPGDSNAELVVQARGPGLRPYGVVDAVDRVTLELRDANGVPVGSNQEATGAPRELPSGFGGDARIRVSVPRGNYTALVWASSHQSGVALVEFYDLRQ